MIDDIRKLVGRTRDSLSHQWSQWILDSKSENEFYLLFTTLYIFFFIEEGINFVWKSYKTFNLLEENFKKKMLII